MTNTTLQYKLLYLHAMVKKMRKYQISAKEIKSDYDKSMAIHYAAFVDNAICQIDRILNIIDIEKETKLCHKMFFGDNISDHL